MTQTFLALSLGFAGVLLATKAAYPAPQCGERDRIVAHLAERFGETRHSMGLSRNALMEIYASDTTGTWTLTVTTPDGVMCLVAVGSSFDDVNDARPAKGRRI